MVKEAISYKGYALVDIHQPCVSFNKINTFSYYKERVYYLETGHDYTDKAAAMVRAMEFDGRIPIGILYCEEKPDYPSKHTVLAGKESWLTRNVIPALSIIY
ncbi:MAG TPA: hypothetical protein PK304_04705 [Mobilitalea sp.]|nr:hypothetical protein [Mobilitalea sp.]